jgi:hypothetical protein
MTSTCSTPLGVRKGVFRLVPWTRLGPTFLPDEQRVFLVGVPAVAGVEPTQAPKGA